MVIHIFIPSACWDGFKNQVLSAWYAGDPAITKHNNTFFETLGFVFATFAGLPEDVNRMMRLIPPGTVWGFA